MKRLFSRTLTMQLWRRLWGRIPNHPLITSDYIREHYRGGLGCSPMTVVALLILGIPALWIIGFVFAMFAILMGGTLRGLASAMLTARAVNHERMTGRMELLAVSPGGILGMGWLLGLREIRLSVRGQFILRYSQNAQRVIALFAFIILAGSAFGMALVRLDVYMDTENGLIHLLVYLIGQVLTFVLLLIWFITDNAQATLIGLLAGVWSGAHARNMFEARALAAAAFVGINAPLIFAAMFYIGSVTPTDFLLHLYPAVIGIVVARELILRGLWRFLHQRVNAADDETLVVLRL